jgi:opacity protein-like surface antigen
LLDSHPAIGRGRVELEAARRQSSVDKLEFVEGTLPASGDLTVNSLMVNTIADYRDHNSRLVPYLCIGGGYAEVSVDQVRPLGTPFIASGSDGVWAYQLGAGLGIELSDHFAFDIGYRYFGTQKPKFTLADGSSFTSEIVSHNLRLGLRYKF